MGVVIAGVVERQLRPPSLPSPSFSFSFLFRAYSIENEGLGNSFTFFVTFPGMLVVTAEHNEYALLGELDQFVNNFNGRRKHWPVYSES